jgi:hypothetical protein
LRDGDPVQGAVQLAVAATVKPMAPLLARAGLKRGDAGVAGEPSVACEALDRADLTQQLGRAQRAAARKLQQPRGERLRPRLQLTLERDDLARRGAAAGQPPPPESAPLSGRHHRPRMTVSSGMTLEERCLTHTL